MSERNGDWIQTFTGRQFWPIDPRPEEVHIEDIAHALSLQCRFSGHCKFHYSVAQHSWLVALVLSKIDPSSTLWGLLHDAPEAYCVDLPRPIKRHSALGDEYSRVENRLMEVICERFGLPKEMPESVKVADNLLLAIERRDIMGPCPAPWRPEDLTNEPLPLWRIEKRSPWDSEQIFLERFSALTKGGA